MNTELMNDFDPSIQTEPSSLGMIFPETNTFIDDVLECLVVIWLMSTWDKASIVIRKISAVAQGSVLITSVNMPI